jgi:hypothetical protein
VCVRVCVCACNVLTLHPQTQQAEGASPLAAVMIEKHRPLLVAEPERVIYEGRTSAGNDGIVMCGTVEFNDSSGYTTWDKFNDNVPKGNYMNVSWKASDTSLKWMTLTTSENWMEMNEFFKQLMDQMMPVMAGIKVYSSSSFSPSSFSSSTTTSSLCFFLPA